MYTKKYMLIYYLSLYFVHNFVLQTAVPVKSLNKPQNTRRID